MYTRSLHYLVMLITTLCRACGGRICNATVRSLERRRRARLRRMDLSRLTQDQMNFIAQRNNPGGKKTFYQYIFNLEYDKLRS